MNSNVIYKKVVPMKNILLH